MNYVKTRQFLKIRPDMIFGPADDVSLRRAVSGQLQILSFKLLSPQVVRLLAVNISVALEIR